MPDHSSDATMLASDAREVPSWHAGRPVDADDSRTRGTRHQARTDWRLGGRTVRRWREWLLAVALLSLGLGILASAVAEWLWPSMWGGVLATALLLIGMLAPVVWALSRSVPAGMLRIRPVDLLYGIVLAGILRVVQGWAETAFGGVGALPSYTLVDGHLTGGWWFTDALAVVGIAPVVEEFFFRGVILVALYSLLRRPFGRIPAGVVAVAASTGAFVLVHGLAGALSADHVISLALLGVVCGLLVVLTGRIWGAVLVHVMFNASFVALAFAGTFLG